MSSYSIAPPTRPPHHTSRARIASLALLIMLGVMTSLIFSSGPQTATAATVSFSQCNNRAAGPGGAPLSVTCSVNIVNSITPSGNSSTVTFSRNCTLNPCTGDVVNSSDVVNAVSQCNGSDNVGGSTTVCSVNITNNIVLTVPGAATAITVNQCVGSGGGGGTDMTACIPSAQGSPTVVQCNSSGNGGGGKMACNASGTVSAAFPLTVNQCNGSENGGGSFVTCTTSITNNITVVQIPSPTPVGVATATPLPGESSPTPIAGTPVPTPALPPLQQPPVFIPPQPPVFIPPQVLVPPLPPVTFPPVAVPPVAPPVAPPVVVPPVAPPLPPQTGVVFPPEEGFRPPSAGDAGLVRPRSKLRLVVWFLERMPA